MICSKRRTENWNEIIIIFLQNTKFWYFNALKRIWKEYFRNKNSYRILRVCNQINIFPRHWRDKFFLKENRRLIIWNVTVSVIEKILWQRTRFVFWPDCLLISLSKQNRIILNRPDKYCCKLNLEIHLGNIWIQKMEKKSEFFINSEHCQFIILK